MSDNARVVALWLLLTAPLGACRSVDVVATRVQGGASLTDGGSDAAADAGAADVGADAVRDAAPADCEQSGPRYRVGDNAPSRTDCPDGSGAPAFLQALCVCEGYTAGNTLLTDTVNSAATDFPASSPGGSVGVNGVIEHGGFYLRVGGSLVVAGGGMNLTPSVAPAADLEVGEDLQVGGALQGAGCGVAVGGDARVADRLVLEDLQVGGQLTVPEGVEINVNGGEQVASLLRETVQVDRPCGCDEGDLLDIAAIVDERAALNDNAQLDFDPAELEDYQGLISRTLPCGHFFLNRLSGRGELELVISGRAALYVLGQVHFEGPVYVQLEHGAELDLFFAGDLAADDTLQLGQRNQPERVRLYVGGTGTVNLAKQSWLAGHLYAPRAELVTAGPLEVFGSVFARAVNDEGGLTIHRDTNPLEAGEACP